MNARFQMNFTTSYDDVIRFCSAEDLRTFYKEHGCDGLEVMPLPYSTKEHPEIMLPSEECPLIEPDMVTGVHCWCLGDWMEKDRGELIEHYRRDLAYAQKMNAEYVVFHVVQVTDEEGYTYQMKHSDREVIEAAASFINELLDGQSYDFWFLMENLWWPGLTFLNAEESRLLLELVHYKKKGFMLDTGHFLHTDLDLKTQEEGIGYLHQMLDAHEDLIPYIRGVHLNQSLTGDYVKEWLKDPEKLTGTPEDRFRKIYEHIFQIDRHEPFTVPETKKLVERIDPQYVTYEYITRSREELREYLEAGRLY